MSRTVSSTLKQAITAQQTDQVFLLILEITHTDITTLRFVNNTADVVSDGNTYTAWPFQIDVPIEDTDKNLPSVTITIDNIDQSIVQVLRGISTSPTISVSIILASDPDTIEAGPYDFTLRNIDYSALTITGQLGHEDILNESFPGDSFTPENFGGLF